MEKHTSKDQFNPKGGRPKLDEDLAQKHRVQIYVTTKQLKQLEEGFASSGLKSMSAYLVKQLFSNKQQLMVNPIHLLETIDRIGTELNQVGKNINQIAKYANSQLIQEKVNPELLTQFNKQMSYYLQTREKLVRAYKAIVRNFK